MPHQRDPMKEKYWRRLLGQWRQSGLSASQFCQRQGISQPSFYSWRREIARRDEHCATVRPSSTPTFVKLALEGAAPPPLEIVLADGRLLRVRPGFDAALLRQVLRLLEEPSC
jgi:transposase